MNFEFGEVLTHAWQITWRNKVLWVVTVLPFLISFLLFPVWLIVAFTQNLDPNRILGFMENQNYIVLITVFYLIIFIVSSVLHVISRASVTLGVYRVEAKQPIAFMDLLKDGLPYFWRILGVALLMIAGMIVFFLAFFACAALLSVATMGLGAICIQPLFLLMIPLMFLVMAFMEQAESAIIADGMSVPDSARRAYELIKTNVWKYMLITFVVYFGMNILISMIAFPFMIPMFLFMMNNFENGMDFSNMYKLQAVFAIVLLPLMTLIQGFALTYMKSAMMVTYLRLTRSTNGPQPSLQVATA